MRENAFGCLLTPQNRRLPIGDQPWELAELAVARRRVVVPGRSDPVHDLADQIRRSASGDVVSFLARLCAAIYDRMEVVLREEGPPWPAATTLEQHQGACCDLAMLFIDALPPAVPGRELAPPAMCRSVAHKRQAVDPRDKNARLQNRP